MRIISRQALIAFCSKHPRAEPSLAHWYTLAKSASWRSTADVQSTFPKAKVIDGERIRFEIAGGNFRLIAAFDFHRGIAFIKFIGTHAEYDRVDARTVSQF